MKLLYKKFAKYYDLIYKDKKYNKETKFILGLIKKNKIKGKNLLEIGCGTGGHAIILKKEGFNIVGIDLSKEMLDVAKKKTKSIKFIQGDMRNFNLKKKFDIILCLFSVIRYNKNYNDIKKTIRNFYKHLKKDGLLIFDMGFNKERFKDGYLDSQVVKIEKNTFLVRIGKSIRENKNNATILFAYVLIKNKKIEFFKEEHNLCIFDTVEVKKLTGEIGFKAKLYENYTNKPWNQKSKKYVVFACLKK